MSFLFVFTLLGCASTQKTNNVKYYSDKNNLVSLNDITLLLTSKDIEVIGEIADEEESSSGSMMYSGAAGLAGFAAQIAAHAAAEEGSRNSQYNERQLEANKILVEFNEVISALTEKELFNSISDFKTADILSFVNTNYVLKTNPVFNISQDLNTLTVSVTFTLLDLTTNSKVVYENMVEVLDTSTVPGTEKRIKSSNLKEKLIGVYNKSLNIVLTDIVSPVKSKGNKMANFKIYTGEIFRFERGELLVSLCGDKVVRNLRGWLIAYNDIKVKPGSAECVKG